jgi:hypothetical protein
MTHPHRDRFAPGVSFRGGGQANPFQYGLVWRPSVARGRLGAAGTPSSRSSPFSAPAIVSKSPSAHR